MSSRKRHDRGGLAALTLILLVAFIFPNETVDAQQDPEPVRIIKRVKIKHPAKKPAPAGEEKAAPKKAKEKAPAVEAKKPVAVKKKPVVTKKKPVTKPVRKAAVVKKAEGGEAWAINVASYASAKVARETAKKFKAAGYNAYTVGFDYRGVHWNRLRVGFYPSRAAAEKEAKKLSRRFKIEGAWVAKPSKKEVRSHRK